MIGATINVVILEKNYFSFFLSLFFSRVKALVLEGTVIADGFDYGSLSLMLSSDVHLIKQIRISLRMDAA